MKKTKIKLLDLVEVEWVDSIGSGGKWVWLKDLDWEDYLQKISHKAVGYVIENREEFIAITQSKQEFGYEDKDRSVLEPLIVPWGAIRKLRKK